MSELNQLLNSRPPQARKINNRKTPRQVYRLLPAVVALRTLHEASPPSITASDMRANAGLSSKGAQRRARIKLKEFKKTAKRAFYPNETIPRFSGNIIKKEPDAGKDQRS